MREIRRGDLLFPGQESLEEGPPVYSFSRGAHSLLLRVHKPTRAEVKGFRKDPIRFALVRELPALIFAFQFKSAFPWMDTPYSWHTTPLESRVEPTSLSGEQRATLQMILANCSNGIVAAIRLVTFTPQFSQALHDAIREQASLPWEPTAFYSKVSQLMTAYPSDRLQDIAAATCEVGRRAR